MSDFNSSIQYRGYTITYDPGPLPGPDWCFLSNEDDPLEAEPLRAGSAPTLTKAKAAIDHLLAKKEQSS